MKTLIFNGSPKKQGDTAALIRELTAHLQGEVREISCHSDIQPCSDCRACWHSAGCSIDDGMQDIYPYIEECDHIVIASPIWFSSLSGPLLSLASRLQTYFAARRFRKAQTNLKEKSGTVIIVGAEPGTEVVPAKTALSIMKMINVNRANVETIYSLDTDNIPAGQDSAALARCREVAGILNRLYER